MMIDEILAFFRKGTNADMVFFDVQGEWSPPWTVAANNPGRAYVIVQQSSAMAASRFRHCSAAHLRLGSWQEDVVVITDYPSLRQEVYGLRAGKTIDIAKFAETPVVAALQEIVEVQRHAHRDASRRLISLYDTGV